MKINKYGTVTLREGQGPLIEGWDVEREPEDPADATMEQLLLGFTITWARERFDAAVKSATMEALRKIILRKKAEAALTTKKERTDT